MSRIVTPATPATRRLVLAPPHVYEAMLERLNADLRGAIQEGMASGPAIPAEDVFAELNACDAKPKRDATKTGGKRKA